MRQIVYILIIALFGIGCRPAGKIEYSIDREKIDNYRKQPVTNGQLIDVIQNNNEFINLNRNSAITEATLEHHLMDQFSKNGITTHVVFEYFSLEGITCNLKAVSFDTNNNLLSILRLANYEEYPDGKLNESTLVENDFAYRTTIVTGIQEYDDSLDQLIIKIDSTIMKFKLNNFKQIEVVDSVFKHHEYFE